VPDGQGRPVAGVKPPPRTPGGTAAPNPESTSDRRGTADRLQSVWHTRRPIYPFDVLPLARGQRPAVGMASPRGFCQSIFTRFAAQNIAALVGGEAAAMLAGVPLALGSGTGSEMRQPLGYAMVGGLALSQLLTLYTTPVVYLYLDRLQTWLQRNIRHRGGEAEEVPAVAAE
jgi:hypothetical protein